MKGGYSYHFMASFKHLSVLVTEIVENDDDDCPATFSVMSKRLAASLRRSHSTKSIMASAKERAKSSVRETVRCWINSAEKGSRIFALRVTWRVNEAIEMWCKMWIKYNKKKGITKQ